MIFTKPIVLTTIAISMAGCASATHRGVVAMKLNDTKAHVGIGSSEVAVGDHVELYRNQCKNDAPGRNEGSVNCTKKEIGHGVVTQVLSTDYSEVTFDPGVEFHEGDTIEKHAH